MSDLISRQAAIEALKNDMASLDHIIKGMSANDVRLDAYVSQRNQVNYDIYTINNLPPAQPEPDQNGDLWITVPDIDKVTRIYVQESKSKFCRIFYEEQPERIKGRWIPSDGQLGIKCSECGLPPDDFCYSIDYIDLDYAPNFCPNCGSDNREVTT